jgi:hypothetical protein
MKLNPIGANKTELHTDNGNVILFSYKTPVAAFVEGQGWIKTSKKWSVTTSKHITQWIPRGANVREVDQATLDAMVA